MLSDSDSFSNQSYENNSQFSLKAIILVFLTFVLIASVFSFFMYTSPESLSFVGPSKKLLFFIEMNRDFWHSYVVNGSGLQNISSIIKFFLYFYASFLTCYLAPIKYKKKLMILFFWTALLYFFSFYYALAFFFLILASYLLVHFENEYYYFLLLIFVTVSFFLGYTFGIKEDPWIFLWFPLSVISISLASKTHLINIPTAIIRNIPAAMILFGVFILRGRFFNSQGVLEKEVQIGLIFFLQYTLRSMFHSIDLRDGSISFKLSFVRYLEIFCLIPDFLMPGSAFHPGQGLSYLNKSFYEKNKNSLIYAGVKSSILGISYFVIIFPLTWHIFKILSSALNYQYFTFVDLYALYTKGTLFTFSNFALATVWEMLFMSYFLIGGLHFKVGLYRIFGFNIQSYTNYPWLATSLPDFWKRYGYHYAQLILKGFYLPAFLKLKPLSQKLRIYVSVFYACIVGHLLTYNDLALYGVNMIQFVLYPFFLAIGIAYSFNLNSSQLIKRKPWTMDRYFLLDLAKITFIIAFYSFVSIFMNYNINRDGKLAIHLIFDLVHRYLHL